MTRMIVVVIWAVLPLFCSTEESSWRPVPNAIIERQQYGARPKNHINTQTVGSQSPYGYSFEATTRYQYGDRGITTIPGGGVFQYVGSGKDSHSGYSYNSVNDAMVYSNSLGNYYQRRSHHPVVQDLGVKSHHLGSTGYIEGGGEAEKSMSYSDSHGKNNNGHSLSKINYPVKENGYDGIVKTLSEDQKLISDYDDKSKYNTANNPSFNDPPYYGDVFQKNSYMPDDNYEEMSYKGIGEYQNEEGDDDFSDHYQPPGDNYIDVRLYPYHQQQAQQQPPSDKPSNVDLPETYHVEYTVTESPLKSQEEDMPIKTNEEKPPPPEFNPAKGHMQKDYVPFLPPSDLTGPPPPPDGGQEQQMPQHHSSFLNKPSLDEQLQVTRPQAMTDSSSNPNDINDVYFQHLMQIIHNTLYYGDMEHKRNQRMH